MASANLELAQSIFAAWQGGDYSSANWAHPEIEFVIVDGPAPGRWTGVAAMAEAFRDFLSAFEDYHPEAEEFRELDDERILVLTHSSGRGKTSGVELAQMWSKGALLLHIHGGKVTRDIMYFDRERAFADLGRTSKAGSTRS
jgi:ketosteroid isomerase-like protein